jgi:beta-aspartyl-dipeptidase (metallo-type)
VFTVIEHGTIYAPEPRGLASVLIIGDRIVKIGAVDTDALRATRLPCRVIDASGRLVTPGLIDPHEHLIGAGGEQGFGSRRPEVPFADIVRAGITTVVGCLGTDTVTRHLTTLLARAHQLREAGLTAYIHTGGFPVPTPTITGSVAGDLVLIDLVIGVGEVAISDVRASKPTLHDLASLVTEAFVGGSIGGKAGVVHFHTGPGKDRLSLLHHLIEELEVAPSHLHATHINRSEALMDDAIALARKGAFVDIDAVGDEGIGRWLRYYREHDGPWNQLTISSDAHTPDATPGRLRAALTASVRQDGVPLAEVLTLFTTNPARVLKLATKGRLCEGADADIAILAPDTLAVTDVFARGRHLVANGAVVADTT